jgi:hypothetical protein
MSVSAHSFTAAESGPAFLLKPGESATYAVTGTYVGLVRLEKSRDLLAGWATLHQGEDGEEFDGTVRNETAEPLWYRFVAADLDAETQFDDQADTEIADAVDVIETWRNSNGDIVAQITESGFIGNVDGDTSGAVEGDVVATTLMQTEQDVTPDDAEGAAINVILPGVTAVAVGANVNGVDDFIVLPALASVPVGHCITVVSNAAGHEVRTPAESDEEINSENSDGTKEYAIAAGGEIHRFTKIDNTVGWMGQGFTAIGAVVTAVVPD